MGDKNACTECGYMTSDLEDFSAHVAQHEEVAARAGSSETESKPETWDRRNKDSTLKRLNCDLNLIALSPNTSSEGSVCQQSPPAEENSSNPDFMAILPPGRNPNNKSDKQLLTCPHCKFQTYMSQHMKSHLDAHERHQGQMYQCDICHMQFSQKANMHRHRMRHSGVRPYPCKYCDKKFFRKDQMQEHSMTHIKTGVDFDCPVTGCAAVCSQHSMLRSHLEDVHQISSFNSSSCKKCSLVFTNARRLLLHYQTKHEDGGKYSVAKTDSNASTPIATNGGTFNGGIELEKLLETASQVDPSPFEGFLNDLRMQQLLDSANTTPTPTTPTSKKRGTKRTKANAAKEESFEKISKKDGEESPFAFLTNAALKNENNTSSFEAFLKHDNFTDQLAVSVKDLLGAFKPDISNKNGIFNLGTPPPTISNDVQSHTSSDDSAISVDFEDACAKPVSTATTKNYKSCNVCDIIFSDPCIYLLHKGLHDEEDPFKCNLCGQECKDLYTFSCHVINAPH
uniref:C2H2-type domain-containing protein n=1 Tax=Rhabditophanes sp. KR3021 TaxID=114890 RepID=A0AC35U453_9BILA